MQATRSIFVLIWLSFVTAAPAQYHYPKKDVVFAQVVVGGGFETVINLTNRGRSEYTGTLQLFRFDNSPWNPEVNGQAAENGEYAIEIPSGTTVALRLTGSDLESGGAILRAGDLRLDNLIEANLTYRVLEGGQVSDSVGIAPSTEFYRASLPFENFAEVGIALVNGGSSGDVIAKIDLSLFLADGRRVRTERLRLGPRSHQARFLYEFFPDLALEGGRIEIVSDALIFGMALTLTGREFSSLPLEPTAVHYFSVRLEVERHERGTKEARVASGELALWAEGSFLRGYLAIVALDGEAFEEPEFSLVNGELEGSRFRLAITMRQDPFFAEEATLVLGAHSNSFLFGERVFWGEWVELFSDETILKGRYRIARR